MNGLLRESEKVVVKESLVVRYLGDERGVRVGMMRAGRHARLRRLGGHPRSRAARRADRRRSSSLLQLARTVLLLQAETLSHKGEKAMHPRRESLWTHSWNNTLAGTIYIGITHLEQSLFDGGRSFGEGTPSGWRFITSRL